jgi:hypothetical protein
MGKAILMALQLAQDSGGFSPPSSGTWSPLAVAIVGALAGAIGTGVISYLANRSSVARQNTAFAEDLRTLQEAFATKAVRCETLEAKLADTEHLADRYRAVREKLQMSSVVRRYYQPVLLIGPRAVGKTSLLMQWHAPWNHGRLDMTVDVWCADVPIHDYIESESEPHFADSTILTSVHAHLFLRVYDFPGELSAQPLARQVAMEETLRLNDSGKQALGVVLICMFDALEAHSGITHATSDYYNGELFRELFTLTMHNDVFIEKIVLVFNKYDLLREAVGEGQNDEQLLRFCLDRFRTVYGPLYHICNHERMRATFTILNRESMREKNRGSPIVLGEAARNFVRVFAGSTAADEIIQGRGFPLPPSTSPGF